MNYRETRCLECGHLLVLKQSIACFKTIKPLFFADIERFVVSQNYEKIPSLLLFFFFSPL